MNTTISTRNTIITNNNDNESPNHNQNADNGMMIIMVIPKVTIISAVTLRIEIE